MKAFSKVAISLALVIQSAGACRAQSLKTEHDSCSAYENSPVPKYHIERKQTGAPGTIVNLFVSISPLDANRDKLIALGCALGRRFAAQDFLAVYILTDRESARQYNPQGEGNSRSVVAAFRGRYTLLRDEKVNGQAIDLRLDPESPYATVQILLGLPPERPARKANRQ